MLLRRVRDSQSRDFQVRWRYFSLAEVNRTDGRPVWEDGGDWKLSGRPRRPGGRAGSNRCTARSSPRVTSRASTWKTTRHTGITAEALYLLEIKRPVKPS